ncbi:MAG: hypothetical protein P1V51_00450 [Deltaproteobacteria bacterium]|nr:hypothetical protein [Deltaproteobacteria bacterium]
MPNSPHGVLMQTPTTNSNVPCGTQIFQSFLNDPTVAPNTWCTSRLLPINFNGHPGYAQYFLGTDDFWENAKTRSEEPAPARPGVEESLRFSRSLAPLR